MYVIVVWHIAANVFSEGPIDSAFRSMLAGFSWVRPLNNVKFYVVKVADQSEREALAQRFTALAKEYPQEASVLVSQVYTGNFSGFIAQDMWPKLNERTQ